MKRRPASFWFAFLVGLFFTIFGYTLYLKYGDKQLAGFCITFGVIVGGTSFLIKDENSQA